MKSKNILFVILFALMFSLDSNSQPQPWQEVGRFVETTTSRMMKYVGHSGLHEREVDWELSAAWLRIQAQFGIEVPWLAALRIVPEVEIVFEED